MNAAELLKLAVELDAAGWSRFDHRNEELSWSRCGLSLPGALALMGPVMDSDIRVALEAWLVACVEDEWLTRPGYREPELTIWRDARDATCLAGKLFWARVLAWFKVVVDNWIALGLARYHTQSDGSVVTLMGPLWVPTPGCYPGFALDSDVPEIVALARAPWVPWPRRHYDVVFYAGGSRADGIGSHAQSAFCR